VTIVRVVGKQRTAVVSKAAFGEMQVRYSKTSVDVGTGDGRFAYHLASADPDRLVIGVDALAEPMGERAATAARKPVKGGRPNLIFVHAAVEMLPDELQHAADEVYVLLPWGGLLEGIVSARPEVLSGIAALCRTGTRLVVTLNGEIWVDSTPARYSDLPVATPEHVAEVVAPGFARVGIQLGAARYATAAEAKQLSTTWARRLGHGRDHPCFVQFDGIAS